MLAIDTATEQAGVALFDGAQLAEVSWPGGRRHTTTVLPAIESLLRLVGIDLNSVGSVAVATGPGSFTGLRVGLSLAKGFAITGERVVIGIPTLDVSARPFRAMGVDCIAVAPAGRARLVWSIYPGSGSASPPVNTTFAEFLQVLTTHPDLVVVGEFTTEQRRCISTVHGAISSPAMSNRRPSVLAEIGYKRWIDGDMDEPETLEPFYLHGQPNSR